MSTKTLVAAFAAIAALASAVSAQASPTASRSLNPEVISVRVPLADLDLGAKAGAAVALHRIRNAAQSICGNESGFRNLSRHALYNACVDKAAGKALASLDAKIALAQNAPGAAILVSSRR
jgi:UrcA family protein